MLKNLHFIACLILSKTASNLNGKGKIFWMFCDQLF